MHNRLFCRIRNFAEIQKFWCHDCDTEMVSSEDEETGTFFGIFGTKMDFKDGKSTPTSEYIMVCFALCPSCLSGRKESFDFRED